MLKWLDEPAFKKIMKSLARQNSYGDDVGDSIEWWLDDHNSFEEQQKHLLKLWESRHWRWLGRQNH
ncbi:hypothetical protein HYALB_00008217 [Hymenoscyphus albidus]|uniref:Uncharacterized protein n=1 Tax=Hymenoscyphus albidus TaxID=595503 RepID=A0A9N9LWC3_9HELO|nr:hypothetical protein HYALB_00008217 [Hymenoscyphus albidus]